MPIFCVKSVKIYTGQKKFYMNIFVAFVTNIKYAGWLSSKLQRAVEHVSHCCTCSLLKLRCYLTFVPLNGLLKGKLMDNAKQLIMIMI